MDIHKIIDKPSHKRALSSGKTPAPKQTKVTAPQYVYITMSTTKQRAWRGNEIEETPQYHDAYQTEEDARNALKQMANEDYPDESWEVDEDGLRLYTNNGFGEGYEDDDEGTELKVEMVELKPKGCVLEVKLLRPVSHDSDGEDDEGDEHEHDDVSEDSTVKQPRTEPIPKHQQRLPVPWTGVSLVCNYCRKRKVRCSGSDSAPDGRCQNCVRFNQQCLFEPVSKVGNVIPAKK